MKKDKLSVVGLGKLGLCLAASFAKSGFDVLGVDVVPEIVEGLNQGRTGLREPELAALIAEFFGKRLTGTLSHAEAINQTDVSCVMVHTPSSGDGHFSNRYVLRALASLGEALRQSRKPYHLFIINSTVRPGTMTSEVIPQIERTSGRKLNEGFGLCYSPELVALGSVIRDFTKPDMVVIGTSDQRAGENAEAIYGRLCRNNPPIFKTSLVNAEIFKIALNAFITVKLSFANALANLCENIPEANADAITQALGADRRIGPYFIKGGLSFGGTCFPRDTKAFLALAKSYGCSAPLVEAAENINLLQDEHLFELVFSEACRMPERAVSVLGLAFKPNTDVIVESPAIKLIGRLLDRKVKVAVYDPLAIENARAALGGSVTYSNSIEECLAQSPVCVITTPDAAYRQIQAGHLSSRSMTVIDCWRILEGSDLGHSVRYVTWGRGPSRQAKRISREVAQGKFASFG